MKCSQDPTQAAQTAANRLVRAGTVIPLAQTIVLGTLMCLAAGCPGIDNNAPPNPAGTSTNTAGVSGGIGVPKADMMDSPPTKSSTSTTAGQGGMSRPLPPPRNDLTPVAGRSAPPPTGDPCDQCVDRECGQELRACGGSASCQSVVKCIGACADGDSACIQDCRGEFPAGATLFTAFATCYRDECQVCNDKEDMMSSMMTMMTTPKPPIKSSSCQVTNPGGWTEAPVWSQQQAEACLEECDDDDCVKQQCDDGDRFIDCIAKTRTECVGAPGKACRPQYEAFLCCILTCQDETATESQLEACIERDCPSEREQWFSCRGDVDCASQFSLGMHRIRLSVPARRP